MPSSAEGLVAVAGVALLAVAVAPPVARWCERRRLALVVGSLGDQMPEGPRLAESAIFLPAVEVAAASQEARGDAWLSGDGVASFLSSWQAVGGCGAGSGASTGSGVKWIGRSVTGGLFNVQQQFLYTKLGSSTFPEHNYTSNTLISFDVGQKWALSVNVPLIYRYLVDPTHVGGAGSAPVDYTNAGLGDVTVMGTRRLGDINDTLVTAMVGLPTGTYDASFSPGGTPINQSLQLGFGKPTATLVVDHLMDKLWGIVVVGGVASWRGGENSVHNYRAPSGTLYSYAGYFWGSLVPAFGMALTGFTGHDRDQDALQYSPLAILSANVSLEWSSDWIAVLLAASLPYRYDGFTYDDNRAPRSPFWFMPWTLGLGVAVAPF